MAWAALLCIVLALQQVSSSINDDFFSLSANDIDGNTINFSKFKGMVTLVVNSASMCGFADSHLRDLTRMHNILGHGAKFEVLLFPCNQFGDQEPGEAAQVKQYVLVNFDSEFQLMDKIDVIGENAHPVYKNIVGQSSTPPDWNFYKYLVDHTGRVTHAWGPRVAVADIFADVQAAVDAAKAAGRDASGAESESEPDPPVGPDGDTSRDEL